MKFQLLVTVILINLIGGYNKHLSRKETIPFLMKERLRIKTDSCR